ncbi:MAG TPA: hypothetical protein VN706_21970 [Gemmatimonadaceae bacterium]|nr:hypothetical protein [Gemmatimonadaceae bacterium]
MAAISLPARAQYTMRTWLPWSTIETAHFAFHYPADLEQWTRSLATRAEAIHDVVQSIVGYAPPKRTQVVVDDPYDLSNGFAYPFIDEPVINLWAVAPDPREDVGEFRGWGETLLSHEFTHIAHLSRPSRNPRTRLLTRLIPIQFGPIPVNAPRWVIEGYATYAEGKATGSGRPHGVWRPAFLRQWALEGALPRYEQLDGFGSFNGGEFAYLAGSAFLEWLAQRQGDSSLVALWRRMSARQLRTFDDAFIGVYGESPRALYGRFTTELTGNALEISRHLRAAFPGDTGEVVQRLAWQTGDPSISRDGKRVALVMRAPNRPSRVVVWSTAPQPDTGRAKHDSLLLARDPEDVPARTIYPPPKRVLASLQARAGAPYDNPRFLKDGRILLSRETQIGDGTTRPDLYIWNPAKQSVKRITHGAAVRNADPMPDGRSAVAERCVHGWCDVAVVDLESGRVRVVLTGTPRFTFYHPRVSPDGGRVLVSLNSDGRWELIAFDTTYHHSETIGITHHGNVYDGTWTSPTTIVATSDSSGIPDLISYEIGAFRGFRTLTHVTGAAVAPEFNPADSSIWFLSLYSRGYDLRRIATRGAIDTVTVASDRRLAPAARIAAEPRPPFDSGAVSRPRPFGLGPRISRWFPTGSKDADGAVGILGITNVDVIGRGELIGKFGVGDRASWHGAALDATWRGTRPFIRAEVFDARQSPSGTETGSPPASNLDAVTAGALVGLDAQAQFDASTARARAFATSSRLVSGVVTSRTMFIVEGSGSYTQRGIGWNTSESFSANITKGRSFDSRFDRNVATVGFTASTFVPVRIAAAATYGFTSDDAPAFERMALGGSVSPILDPALLTQRVPMPVLPTGVATGTSAFAYKISLIENPLALYWWQGSATEPDRRFATWHRVAGAEWTVNVPQMQAVGTPAARAVVGGGESLDVPLRHRFSLYASLVLTP